MFMPRYAENIFSLYPCNTHNQCTSRVEFEFHIHSVKFVVGYYSSSCNMIFAVMYGSYFAYLVKIKWPNESYILYALERNHQSGLSAEKSVPLKLHRHKV